MARARDAAKPAESVGVTWRKLESALEEWSKPARRALRGPVTTRDLDAIRKILSTKLPADFIRSLKIHDGMRDGPRLPVNEWLLPARQIAKQAKMMLGLFEPGDLDPGPRFSDRRRIRTDVWWRRDWLPLSDNEGDGFVLDLDPAPAGAVGQVFYFYHDGARPPRVVAPSFSAWLADMADRVATADPDDA